MFQHDLPCGCLQINLKSTAVVHDSPVAGFPA
jgi:hypothetical protein